MSAQQQIETEPEHKTELADEAWSFSTTIASKSELDAAVQKQEQSENGNGSGSVPQRQAQSEPVMGVQTSPEVQIVEEEKASPPTRGRAQQQVNGSARKYRISFSESHSDARA